MQVNSDHSLSKQDSSKLATPTWLRMYLLNSALGVAREMQRNEQLGAAMHSKKSLGTC